MKSTQRLNPYSPAARHKEFVEAHKDEIFEIFHKHEWVTKIHINYYKLRVEYCVLGGYEPGRFDPGCKLEDELKDLFYKYKDSDKIVFNAYIIGGNGRNISKYELLYDRETYMKEQKTANLVQLKQELKAEQATDSNKQRASALTEKLPDACKQTWVEKTQQSNNNSNNVSIVA